ncbi:dihydroxyacetone kinase family protein [Microbacterium aquimaris]|uniref:Dihydroxyacetone kinase family protein n=1 Tax=Microbacterium aquimaris TaxID=459816 RepID=A0ABU5N2B2_9MICO|nr:dihydroxyacetone kinase family protein [Microbacterium aquimaris]MDZ8160226.1 dihydroxyacetone kinase family protein [Microbacterium aquimaris]
MTRLYNNPDDFTHEMIDGFVAASSRWVRRVPGGVARATRGSEPSVAVVIGGGSGHYPAFGGLVGPGLAHGAAMGNLFASPSAQQVVGVAHAAHEGRGVLLTYGNYAGDVLHFGRAQELLREAGIDCRTVLVTDDVWSAPPERVEERRGIAGDLVVFKIAAAAAEEGRDLDTVEALARRANAQTRSFGVAFGGCTMPGSDEPLFDVPAGRMAVGLGIHGEPGIDEVEVPTAEGLAQMFVAKLLEEIPEGLQVDGARVVPLLNGLGSVKYEELYVVYRSIARLLGEAGIVAVSPQVGEFCTSFDMPGASLTLLWLDDELERLWHAPCDTPAFRQGAMPPRASVVDDEDHAVEDDVPDASDASRRAASAVCRALEVAAARLSEAADELGRLDRVAGDGDHGIGMQRGSRAAAAAAQDARSRGAGAGTTLLRAGDAWSDGGGGTSGAIWGEMLRAFGASVGDERPLEAEALAVGMIAVRDAVMSFGKARPGDKTMIDAIVPFADTLTARLRDADPCRTAWLAAVDAADAGAASTAHMTARLGRAKTHGDKSLGTPDPGAISFAMVAASITPTIEEND